MTRQQEFRIVDVAFLQNKKGTAEIRNGQQLKRIILVGEPGNIFSARCFQEEENDIVRADARLLMKIEEKLKEKKTMTRKTRKKGRRGLGKRMGCY